MVRSPNRLPHIQALADFLFNNGLSTNAQQRYFFRNTRIFTQISPPRASSTFHLLDTFRVKHQSAFGILNLVHSESLVQICLQSRNSLIELGLENCLCIDISLLHAVNQCKNLKVLNLSYSNVDDRAIGSIARNNPSLTTLMITRCHDLTAVSLKHLADARSLSQLDFSFSAGLVQNINSFEYLSRMRLTHLLMNGLDITDGHIRALGRKEDLIMLSLLNNELLSDVSLSLIGSNFPNIKMLNIDQQSAIWPNYSVEGIMQLLHKAKQLIVLKCQMQLKTPEMKRILEERI